MHGRARRVRARVHVHVHVRASSHVHCTCATLFGRAQGFVARGASISFLSQYPEEEEVLLPPFTALEVSSSRIEGAVVVVQLRPSLSTACAASGLRTGVEDLASLEAQRQRQRLADRLGRQRVAVERERAEQARSTLEQARSQAQAELEWQKRFAALRFSALERREAGLSQRLAEQAGEVCQLKLTLTQSEEERSALERHAKTAEEAKHAAAHKLVRIETALGEAQMREAIARQERESTQQRELRNRAKKRWAALAAWTREQVRASTLRRRVWEGTSYQLQRQHSRAIELERIRSTTPPVDEPAAAAPSPIPEDASPKTQRSIAGRDEISRMEATELASVVGQLVGRQEQWKAGRTAEDVDATVAACERLVERCTPRAIARDVPNSWCVRVPTVHRARHCTVRGVAGARTERSAALSARPRWAAARTSTWATRWRSTRRSRSCACMWRTPWRRSWPRRSPRTCRSSPSTSCLQSSSAPRL